MHYFLGCNFKEFLFESIHPDELRSKIADRIISQMDAWLPFVTIDELNVLLPEDDVGVPENAIKVNMKFHITSQANAAERLSETIR